MATTITNRRARRLSVVELERRFAELTYLMYDTRVPLGRLEERVFPYLGPDVEFVDPWVHTRGRELFENGLRGFHCSFRFDIDITQLHVRLNERGDGGRVLVDSIMNLRQLRVYTYPLRTLLVYEFVLTEGGTSFQITRQEEMWSLGDMLANLPVAGGVFDLGRRAWGYYFSATFWLSCALRTHLQPSFRGT